jgi:cell division protein FtsB
LAGIERKNLWWSAILLTVIVICGVTLYRGFSNFNKVQDELAQVRQTNQRLDAGNRALYRKVQRLRSDARAQERAVRQEMGLARADEIVYRDSVSPKKEAKPAPAEASKASAASKGGE